MKKLMLVLMFISAMTANAATLVWDASTGADGYKVYYQAEGEDEVYSKIVDGLQLDVAGMNLDPGKNYSIWCTAYNAAGESGPSNTVTYSAEQFVPDDNPKQATINIPDTVRQLILNFE